MYFKQDTMEKFEQKLLSIYNINKDDICARTDFLNTSSEESSCDTDTSNIPNCSDANTNGNGVIFDAATSAVLETGELTPLLKEGLKYKIQARRLAEGKQELKVEFSPPSENELTPEEKIKVQKRKDQNRIAAQKFRQKQKDAIFNLKKKMQCLVSQNTSLRSEMRQLQNEKTQLVQRLREHLSICPLHVQGTVT